MGEISGLTDRAERSGREAHDSDWLDYAIRAGLVAYGIVHLMIAWLAAQLALGEQEGKASSTGPAPKKGCGTARGQLGPVAPSPQP